MNKIIKTFTAESKAIDLEAGIFEAMITTESADRSDDIVRASGARIDAYMRNPVVPWGHDYRELPVAKTLSLNIFPGIGITARFQFPEWGISEKADTVRRMWAAGFLSAVSIGFQPIEYLPIKGGGYDFVEWELLEFSIVVVPANAQALRLAVKSLVEKTGRVLSGANENRLKECQKLLTEVLDQLAEAQEGKSLQDSEVAAEEGPEQAATEDPDTTGQEAQEDKSTTEPTTDEPSHDESAAESKGLADALTEFIKTIQTVLLEEQP